MCVAGFFLVASASALSEYYTKVAPRGGHFVREVDAKAVEDLYDLREMLEKHAIRLAMRRLSEADLAELERVGRQLRRFEDDGAQGEEELREGQRIHEIIARASRND